MHITTAMWTVGLLTSYLHDDAVQFVFTPVMANRDRYHRSLPHSYVIIGVLLSASKGQGTCFLSLSKRFSPPAVTMDDYEVIGQIGEGAFGKAFLVQERQRGDGACRCVVKEVDLRKVGSSPTWQAA